MEADQKWDETPHGPRSSRQWPPRVRSRKSPPTQREQAQRDIEAERTARIVTQRCGAQRATPWTASLPPPWPHSRWSPAGPSSLPSSGAASSSSSPRATRSTSRTQDFQPVGSWIAAQLGRPEYAHFLRAANPGGGTAGSAGRPVSTDRTGCGKLRPTAHPVPRNMGDAIARQMAGIAKTQAQNPHLSGGSSLTDAGVRVPEVAAGFGSVRSG